jgi:hypothetical protein
MLVFSHAQSSGLHHGEEAVRNEKMWADDQADEQEEEEQRETFNESMVSIRRIL